MSVPSAGSSMRRFGRDGLVPGRSRSHRARARRLRGIGDGARSRLGGRMVTSSWAKTQTRTRRRVRDSRRVGVRAPYPYWGEPAPAPLAYFDNAVMGTETEMPPDSYSLPSARADSGQGQGQGLESSGVVDVTATDDTRRPTVEELNSVVVGSYMDGLLPDLMAGSDLDSSVMAGMEGKVHKPPSQGDGGDDSGNGDDSSDDNGGGGDDSGEGSDDSSGGGDSTDDSQSGDSSDGDNGDSGGEDSDDSDDSGSDNSDDSDGGTDAGSSEVDTEAYQNGILLVTNEQGGTDNGQIQFRDLLRQGALRYVPASKLASPDVSDTKQTYANRRVPNQYMGSGGFVRRWDECSGTPFLTSKAGRQVVTYDDPQSMEMKAMLAMQMGLLGVNMFDVHGDSDQWELVDALRRGLDLEPHS